jgi:hypothetical protein
VSEFGPASLPAAHPLYQTWVMLLNGYGFNWYREENMLRADDLMIRAKASEHLAAAAGRLRDLEGAYMKRHVPPPSREHPFADPDQLAAARRIRAAKERVGELDTRLRGASIPPDDKIRSRYRKERELLKNLADWDTVLVGAAREIDRATAAIPPGSGLGEEGEAALNARLADLAAALDHRNELLG